MIPDDRLVRNVDRTAGHETLNAEPRLHDLLDEPIVRMIMASDNVMRPDLLSLLARIRRAGPHAPLKNETHRDEVWRNQAAAQTVACPRLPWRAKG